MTASDGAGAPPAKGGLLSGDQRAGVPLAPIGPPTLNETTSGASGPPNGGETTNQSHSRLAKFHESIAIIVAAFVGLVGAGVGGAVVMYSTIRASDAQRDQARSDHQADVYADYLSKETEAIRLYNILFGMLTTDNHVSNADLTLTFGKMSDAWSEAGKSAWLVMLVDDVPIDNLRAELALNEQHIPDNFYALRAAKETGISIAPNTQAARRLRATLDTHVHLLETFTNTASDHLNPR